MKSLILLLSLFGGGDIYVNRYEIVTISDSHCDHWEGELTSNSNPLHLVKEDCTEVSLKNGKTINVKEKAKEILKLEKVCK